jgi:hypothetical protein
MEINDLVKEAYELVKEKGFHDEPRTPLEIHALIHSEISEATEAARLPDDSPIRICGIDPTTNKPEGEAVELADAVIRIADYFGLMGWDLDAVIQYKMAFNKGRSYRHGGKMK